MNMIILRKGIPTLQSVSNRSFSLFSSLNASKTNGVPYLASGIEYDIKSKIISLTVNKVGSEKLLAGKSCFM